MAQGQLKKRSNTPVKQAVIKRHNRKLTTQAAKALKPKKRSAVQSAALTKKHTASLTSATEKLLSSRVGHLEVLQGTRREIENDKKSKLQSSRVKPK